MLHTPESSKLIASIFSIILNKNYPSPIRPRLVSVVFCYDYDSSLNTSYDFLGGFNVYIFFYFLIGSSGLVHGEEWTGGEARLV